MTSKTPAEKPMQSLIARLESHLATISRRYPHAWRMMDMFRAERKKLGDWPHWCFAPFSASYAIVSGGGDNRIPYGSKAGLDIGRVAALSAWRITKGIYHFDETLFESIAATPLDGKLPVHLLYHLPEWCVYIPAPGLEFYKYKLVGFFAQLEYDVNEGHSELRLLFDTDDSHAPYRAAGIELPNGLVPFPIHLRAEGLVESIEDAMEYSRRQNMRFGSPEQDHLLVMSKDELDTASKAVAPMVNLVLYLCSIGADVRSKDNSRPTRPMPVKTKKGLRLFAKEKPVIWETGYRLGVALRKAEAETRSEYKGGTHGSPKPHVRVAHWHSFWTGPMKEPDKRRLVLKWLPPIPVAVGERYELIPTLRPVK